MSNYKPELLSTDNIPHYASIAFVTALFNREHTQQLETVTEQYLQQHNINNITKYYVPGAMELPAMTKKVIHKQQPDIVFCFGVVIKGETPHFDYVCSEVARGITLLWLETNCPIIFGVLTLNNEDQLAARINEWYAIAGLNLLNEIHKHDLT